MLKAFVSQQMLVMRWLNRVAYNSPMSPLELELYHQIKNVIGVQPSYYECRQTTESSCAFLTLSFAVLLSVDADTQCERESLNRMVNAMIRDRRMIGLCGETSLSNGRHSFVTMLQVYEYCEFRFLSWRQMLTLTASHLASCLSTSLPKFDVPDSDAQLSKAFESLFGSVTCLPGCFTLFRIKTVDQKPLLCSNQLIGRSGAASFSNDA